MNIIKAIFGRIWALWAILIFVATMLVFLIPFMLFAYKAPDVVRTKRFIAYSRIWMGIYLALIGSPLSTRGKENFKKGENYIVVCNHNSLMDIPVSSPAIPGGNKTIAKIEMANIPLFGMLYRTGSVLVDRKSDASRKESFTKMKQALNLGLHMCIYPEGTRNKTGYPLKTFHSGAFRLAMDTGKSIIPGIIFNTAKVLPADRSFYAMPHPLAIHFLPAVTPLTTDSVDSLQSRVYDIMFAYYRDNK